jgi:hypothetical protein
MGKQCEDCGSPLLAEDMPFDTCPECGAARDAEMQLHAAEMARRTFALIDAGLVHPSTFAYRRPASR